MALNFGIKLIDGTTLTADGKTKFFIFISHLGEHQPTNYDLAVKALSNMRMNEPHGIHLATKNQKVTSSVEFIPYNKIVSVYKIDLFLQTQLPG